MKRWFTFLWLVLLASAASAHVPKPDLVGGLTAERYGDLTFAATNLSLSTTNTFTTIAHNTYGTNSTNITISYLPSSISLAFDSNGNLTNDGTRSFFFDAENELTNVLVAGAWKSEFVYDGFGRRRIEKDYGWSGSAWLKTNEIRYIYDKLLLVQERDSNNVPQVTYARGLDLSWSLAGAGGIGGLLARTDANGSTSFYHADGAGNVTALIDFQQNVVARYLYNPFGKLTGKWGTLADANAMQFSSMPAHRLSGMNEYVFRFYDTGLQRWISQDLLAERGGLNLYEFDANNPLSYVDPDGQFVVSSAAQAAIAAAQAAAILAQTGAAAGIGLGEAVGLSLAGLAGAGGSLLAVVALNTPPSPTLYPNFSGGNPIPSSITMSIGTVLGPDESRDQDGNVRDAAGNVLRDKNGRPCAKRTPSENRRARDRFKNNKEAAKAAWEQRTGREWPQDGNGKDWPAHHPVPLTSGGDPMFVEPQNPNGPDPHNIPGPDGLTDYQRWGAEGTPAREANK